MFKKAIISLFLGLFFIAPFLQAQNKEFSSSEIRQNLKRLNVLGTALYLAAHPDDENTRLIAYLSKGKLLETSYLSLTRGDGGQNLVGTEKGPYLGILRTQELLEARKIDGGHQYFSRAVDFGYSKTAEETFEFWDKEAVLHDMVWVIRQLRPDIIITRFPQDYRAGHGHHTASAMLAEEAMKLAADPDAYPEQLKQVSTWKVHRLVWNTSWWAYRRSGEKFPPNGVVQLETGDFNPLLGAAYNSIASLSRTQHKSQGFGTYVARGAETEYFEHMAGVRAKEDIFEDYDFSWARVKNGKEIQQKISSIIKAFNPERPAASVKGLTEALEMVRKLEDPFWRERKSKELEEVIGQCMGLYMEAVTDEPYACQGDSVKLTVNALSRGLDDLALTDLKLNGKAITPFTKTLAADNKMNKLFDSKIKVEESWHKSQPYWLRKPQRQGSFDIGNDLDLVGKAENDPTYEVTLTFSVNGTPIGFQLPVQYKWRDRVKGELHRGFDVRPELMLNAESPVYVLAPGQEKELKVKLVAGQAGMAGAVTAELPMGWEIYPKEQSFKTKYKGEEQFFTFKIKPGKKPQSGEIRLVAISNGENYELGLEEISYDHILTQSIFPRATAKLVYAAVQASDKRIAYLMGAGDEVPKNLGQIGYNIEQLSEEDMLSRDLGVYDVVMVGIRAFNTIDGIKNIHARLMEYAKAGGKVIVQYQTSYGMKSSDIGPYPLKLGRGRITDETATLKMLDKKHPIFNSPNKIGAEDFEGWVQERGLYFAEEWDEQYTPLLEGADPGEDSLQGMLLVANYGKGKFVFTGLSFFRELPAGVSGAYRLMNNLIEY